MISTATTDRGIAMDASTGAIGCRVRATRTVMDGVLGAGMRDAVPSTHYRITAELCASSFVEGPVWLRPAALDVFVPTTQGRLAWRPPT